MASGPRLKDLELLEVLGSGSFATVWKARDVRLDRIVAVKVLADNWSRDADIHRRFLNEARVLVTSESPRLTRGFAAGETEDGQPYLVMALADRGSLGDRIKSRRANGELFDQREATSIVAELARAIADVHALGHLHRDVKPHNVLISSVPRGSHSPLVQGLASDERIVLSDFGLARDIDATAITVIGGSPGYVAPEQAGGLVVLDERADLYPLGVILLEMLTGSIGAAPKSMPEAAGSTYAVDERLERAGVMLAPGLRRLVERLLSADPQGRPATALALAGELDEFAGDAWTPPPAPLGAPPLVLGGAEPPTLHRPLAGRASPEELATLAPQGTGPAHSPDDHTTTRSRAAMILGGLAVVLGLGLVALLVAIRGTADDQGGSEAAESTPSQTVATEPAEVVAEVDPVTTPTASQESTTTVSTTAAETAPTAAPETATTTPGPAKPGSTSTANFPLPPFSVDDGSDDFRVIANVAQPVAEVTAFFRGVRSEWSMDVETLAVADDGSSSFQMIGPDRTANVTLVPTALSTSGDITRITARFE